MFTLNCGGKLITLDRPLVMGIINVTPDSFYSGSRHQEINDIVQRAGQMLADGADILDIGGQSTRPGSDRITAAEEVARVVPPIQAILKQFSQAVISIDTYYGAVAKAAAAAGAVIINDISAGTLDASMPDTVAALGLPYVLMHMQGTPENMQQAPGYANVVTAVFDSLNKSLHRLQRAGVKDIIIDPGFGFGKTAAHNFTLLRHLRYLKQLGKPILAGLSRKGTIYKTLGTDAAGALNGTTVLNTIALMNGADLLRVHDVKEAAEAVKLFTAHQQ